ncbi:MAG: Coenzyme F420 hydrogenase/dehydrogenase, beta subunit C-terminal domain [Firmicutes bacterium]|nr:Coenzyme F420 hydrogenase/dehydrogenase, beta subunit C-terminal domain [Bacillota bacterium]
MKRQRAVFEKKTCFGCGTCVSVCPQNALEARYDSRRGFYRVECAEKYCNYCGLCAKVCPALETVTKSVVTRPGYSVKEAAAVQKAAGSGKIYEHFLGSYSQLLLGYSGHQGVRLNATSGGAVNAVLRFLIQNKLADEAVLIREQNEAKLKTGLQVINLTNCEALAEEPRAFASRYVSYPLGICLKMLQKNNRAVIVGTPCQIQGFRNYLELKQSDQVILLGIACSGAMSYQATQELFRRKGAPPSSRIYYRGAGWPGKNTIIAPVEGAPIGEGGIWEEDHLGSLWNAMFTSQVFKNPACRNCRDQFAEASDLSFFDLWSGEELEEEDLGKTGIIVRTTRGAAILKSAVGQQYLRIVREIHPQEAIRSQAWALALKKGPKNPGFRIKLHHGVCSLIRNTKVHRLFSKKTYRRMANLFFNGLKPTDAIAREISPGAGGPNFMVIHAHWNNRGDEAAIRAMLDSLLERYPDCRIGIQVLTQRLRQFPYWRDPRIEVIPSFPSRKNWLEIPLFLLFRGRISLFGNSGVFVRNLKKAGLVIHAPGGPSIGDIYHQEEWKYLYRLFLAVWLGKPVFFYAPSMGPFHNKFRNLLRRYLLNRAAGICLREGLSQKYLAELKIKREFWVTLDSAIQNTINPTDQLARAQEDMELAGFLSFGGPIVGVTVTDLKWNPKYRDNPEFSGMIRKVMAGFLEVLTERGYKILFIPQLFGLQNDYDFMNSLIPEHKRDRMLTMSDKWDAFIQQGIIAGLHAVIGMRYHSNIFAAKMGTPFISISYEQKMRGFMDKVGLGEYCLDVKDLTLENLVRVFEKVETEYETYRGKLREIGRVIQAEAGRTNEYLDQVIRKVGKAENDGEG